jgi:2-iminobutanoate/2-iminopropanoate deaminase
MSGVSRKAVHSAGAPTQIGPYSQGLLVDGWLYCSGQIPLDLERGELVGGSIQDQTRKVLENLDAVVRAAGGSLAANAVRCTVFLADMGDFAAVNEVYAGYFEDPPPARAAVEVADLPKGARIEIDLVAFLGR